MVCTSISITWISKIAFLSALCIYRYAYDVIRKLGACVCTFFGQNRLQREYSTGDVTIRIVMGLFGFMRSPVSMGYLRELTNAPCLREPWVVRAYFQEKEMKEDLQMISCVIVGSSR